MGDHHNHHNVEKNLKLTFFITLSFTILEIIYLFMKQSRVSRILRAWNTFGYQA